MSTLWPVSPTVHAILRSFRPTHRPYQQPPPHKRLFLPSSLPFRLSVSCGQGSRPAVADDAVIGGSSSGNSVAVAAAGALPAASDRWAAPRTATAPLPTSEQFSTTGHRTSGGDGGAGGASAAVGTASATTATNNTFAAEGIGGDDDEDDDGRAASRTPLPIDPLSEFLLSTRKKVASASELAAQVALQQSHKEGKHLPDADGEERQPHPPHPDLPKMNIPGKLLLLNFSARALCSGVLIGSTVGPRGVPQASTSLPGKYQRISIF